MKKAINIIIFPLGIAFLCLKDFVIFSIYIHFGTFYVFFVSLVTQLSFNSANCSPRVYILSMVSTGIYS